MCLVCMLALLKRSKLVEQQARARKHARTHANARETDTRCPCDSARSTAGRESET